MAQQLLRDGLRARPDIEKDRTAIRNGAGASAGDAIGGKIADALTLVGGMILLFFTSPKLTLLVLIGVPVVVFPILTLGRRLRILSSGCNRHATVRC